MIIFNASFIIESDKEEAFKAWIADRHSLLLTSGKASEQSGTTLPLEIRVSALRETGGVEHGAIDSHTISIQSNFESLASAKRWESDVFAAMAESFYATFAPNAIIFTSYFETLDIDL